MEGRVKAIVYERRFGFIRSDGVDYFVHDSDLIGVSIEELRPGDFVMFERIEPRPERGPRAMKVRLVERAESEAADA